MIFMMYIDLIFNLSLIVSISVFSGWIEMRWKRHTFRGMLFNGVLFGLTAIVSMAHPINLEPGLIFDGRPVIISICALFFGPWAVSIAALMAAGMRIWLGGLGVSAGLLIILSSLVIGLCGHEILKRKPHSPSAGWLFAFGCVVNLVMLALLYFSLLENVGLDIVKRLWLPVTLIYPLATLIAGKILTNQDWVIRSMDDFQQTKLNLDVTLKSIADAVISTDLYGHITFMNAVAEQYTGWTQNDALGRKLSQVFRIINESTRQALKDPVDLVIESGQAEGLSRHCLLIAKDGTERPIGDSAAPIMSKKGHINGVVLVFRDQSEERRNQKLQEVRLSLVDYSASHSLRDLLRKALDETGQMVDSPVGFYHFVEKDQKTLSLQQWSTRTLDEFCHTEAFGQHYPIDRAGVWVDCVHQKRPVVHNDYASLPHKKGLPEGHAELVRELVVPIFREGLVVAILGVGNKPEDYTDKDVETVSYLADVTWQIVDKKRMEEAREKSEFLFRSVFEHHAAVKLIIDPEDGSIIDANKAAEQYYGWSKDRLKSMKIHEINTLSPGEVKHEMEKARYMNRVYFEFKHRRSDGSVRDVSVFTSKINVNGKDLLHSIVHDITDRKRTEKRLQESELKYRNLIELAPMGIFTTTSTGEALTVNSAMARILDQDCTEETIRHFRDLQSYLYIEASRRAEFLKEITEKGQVENFEYEARTVKNRKIWLRMNARIARKNDDGSFVIDGFATDITAQRRMEEQLRQAQKMESVGRLAGGVAHDYNNMLSVILGYSELALTKVQRTHPLYEDLREIHDAATRSADVTRQLLAFARKQAISPKIIRVNETVEGALKMLRRLIGEDIDLIWLPGEIRWPVKMDPSQIDQVLANLCVNARDAIIGTGKITIETDLTVFDADYCSEHPGFLEGEFVMLAVSDNGVGMDKDTQDNLFEPFFTTKEIGQGTGLGLATVYGITKQNNGFINVYSELGKGTTFRLYFPCDKTPQRVKQEAPGLDVLAGKGETVLLVEDEPAILNMAELMLRKMGYTVLAAGTTVQAMDLAKTHAKTIQLLVTDVIMPEMDGRMLSEHISTTIPGVRFLFMSGYTANVIAQHGVLDEGTNFIQKPFSLQDFARAVRNALESPS